jgi:hypothetical protein
MESAEPVIEQMSNTKIESAAKANAVAGLGTRFGHSAQ